MQQLGASLSLRSFQKPLRMRKKVNCFPAILFLYTSDKFSFKRKKLDLLPPKLLKFSRELLNFFSINLPIQTDFNNFI